MYQLLRIRQFFNFWSSPHISVTMAPIERSATVTATPETIWTTCLEHPDKFAIWDPDVKEVKEPSGASEDETTFIFAMNDGSNFAMSLSNVKKNESLNFSGSVYGIVKAEGKILLTPIDASTTKIDYSFDLTGCIGGIVAMFKQKAIVGGTEEGLANMVKLSKEAQK
jgi:carbon monoxide dehydrogenase subunit G